MLDSTTRRRINRTVLAGKTVERREDAPLAVERARLLQRQLRATRVICGIELIVAGLALIIALLAGSFVVGGIAVVSAVILSSGIAAQAILRPRVQRAEELNRALLGDTVEPSAEAPATEPEGTHPQRVAYASAAIVLVILLTGGGIWLLVTDHPIGLVLLVVALVVPPAYPRLPVGRRARARSDSNSNSGPE